MNGDAAIIYTNENHAALKGPFEKVDCFPGLKERMGKVKPAIGSILSGGKGAGGSC